MSRWARLGGMILGLVFLLAPMAGWTAEVPAPGGPVLTLPQLTEMALTFSPDVKASQSEVKLAKEQKNEVHGYRWPQFDATALGGVVPNAHLPVQTTPGQPLLQRDPKDKPMASTSLGIWISP